MTSRESNALGSLLFQPRGETEGQPRTLLPMSLDPTLRRFGVCVCLLLQDLVQSCVRGEGGVWSPDPVSFQTTPETPTSPRGGCTPLWTGILTGAQLTLRTHYRVGILHGVLGVHKPLWILDRFW
jgi:hypothetical protein